MNLPIILQGQNRSAATSAMLDSGASTIFINSAFVKKHNVTTARLDAAIPLRNADGSQNAIGHITHEARLLMTMGDHSEEIVAAVANTGDDDIILGIDWLRHHNPEIDWEEGLVHFTRCPSSCRDEVPTVARPARAAKAQAITDLDKIVHKINSVKEVSVAEEEGEDEEEDRPLVLKITTEQPQEARWAGGRRVTGGGVRVARMTLQDEIRQFWACETEEVVDKDAEGYLVTTCDEFAYKVAAAYTHSQAIAEKRAVKEGSRTLEELVPKEFQEYLHVFSKAASERMPVPKPYDHPIDLEEGKTPPYAKVYPMAPAERSAMEEWIDEQLAKGYIRPSKSPAAAPVFFVKKKDGTLRLVVDYRKLNAITVKNRYPLPLTQELIDQLSEAKVFTKLDLRWGYNNIRIRDGDQWKAAFRTSEGHFEPVVMNFGLTNAPATFQHMMNDIFQDLRGMYVIVYLDDILIFSKDRQSHVEHVREVLRRLQENDLFCKPEKCEFFQSSVEYLGMIIGQGTVAMDPAKVEAVMSWPQPEKLRDVQAFVGFANFYRRFVAGFSKLAQPLTRLMRKDTPWRWGEDEQASFEALKRAFTSAPILVMADLSKPFILECDASDYATGAVLSQRTEDGQVHPVAFFSKSLNNAERNYDIYDKELLAVVRALGEWRHYLEGSQHTIDILSDHKNLLYFSTARTLTRRQARWSLFLSRFDFTITYRPGRQGGKPDALSRRSDLKPEGVDNEERTLLDPKFFRVMAIKRGATHVDGDRALLRDMRKAKAYDDELVEAIEKLKRHAPRMLQKGLEEWNTEDGLILFRGKVYVPKDNDLRRRIVELHHDSLAAGHPGRWKTYELVSRNYWWPGMSVYVEKYVSGCDKCQRTKNRNQRTHGLLQPNTVPTAPWQIISCDLITQLPKSSGFDAIFVVVDRLTKQAHFIPTTSDVDSPGIADLFVSSVWKYHGTPREVISDRGPQFAAKFLRQVFRRLGIKSALSTAYHPQTDGQTERVNQELEQYLRAFINHRQSDWASLLPMAEFSHNTKAHAATKTSPFQLVYGYEPQFAVLPAPHHAVPAADTRIEALQHARREAQALLEVAADRMKDAYDRGVQQAPEFQPGDLVWLEAQNISLTRTRKLADRRLGPYKIVKKVSDDVYELSLPPTMKIHNVFNVSLLSHFIPDEIEGRTARPPPPVIVDDEEEYEVGQVLDSGRIRGKLHYLIRWKGYSPSEDSWVAAGELEHARAAVDAFHKAHPDALSPSTDFRPSFIPPAKPRRR